MSTAGGQWAVAWPHGAMAVCLTPGQKVVFKSHWGQGSHPKAALTFGAGWRAQRMREDVQLLSGINVVLFKEDL